MPLNFPDNPQQNDTFTVNGRTYTYRGNRWRRTKARLAEVAPTLDIANDFTAGGALHVDSDTGRVGIGTANPQYELHVDGVGEVTGDFQVGQNLDVTGTVDINGLRLTSDGSTISLSEVLAGTYLTQAATTNDDTLATTAFVQSAIANLVDGAPSQLNTLNELAAALNDNASYATTITNALALKLDSSSYTAADVLAKIKTVDGASSGLDADTLDGSHASAFAASSHTHSYLPLSGGTVTGQLQLSQDGQDVLNFSANDTNDSRGIAFNNRTALSADYNDGWLRLNQLSEFSNGVYTPGNIRLDGLLYLGSSRGLRQVSGDYGTVQTHGSGAGNYEGYSIDGRVVFMHDGNVTSGIYNDVDNRWMITCFTNGGVSLYHTGSTKLSTQSDGVLVSGNFTADGNLYVGKNGGGDSYIYFYDDNSNAWREFFWDDSENRFRTSHNMKLSGYLHAGTEMYVGDNGGGDSWVHFYDDNSNTWRTFGWDDSDNEFYTEGGLRLSSGTGVLEGSVNSGGYISTSLRHETSDGYVVYGGIAQNSINNTYAEHSSIQFNTDTYWGGAYTLHTGFMITCGGMNGWNQAELSFRCGNNWSSYNSTSALRLKGDRAYFSLGQETAIGPLYSDAAGRIGYYGSRREWKNVIGEVDKTAAYSRIMALSPVEYTWKPEHRPDTDNTELIGFNVHRGFIAEDVEAVDRVLAQYGWLYREGDGDGDKTGQPLTEELSRTDQTLDDAVVVSYNDKAMFADLVAAVQYLAGRVEELEGAR